MAFVIVDTSLLQVLTTVKRLGLLAKHKPIHIARRVRREHARCAPPPAEHYLETQIKAGLVLVEHPGVDAQAQRLQVKFRKLSFEDAEGLAWARKQQAFLLTEDRALIDAAEAEGCNAIDLAALLLACKHDKVLDDTGLKKLVAAIELDAHHHVDAATKSALGI